MCGVLEQICADKNTSAGMKMTEKEPLCSLEGGSVWTMIIASTHAGLSGLYQLGETLIPQSKVRAMLNYS